eukprot:m.215974 g.215974  ORF g.215974 m.215974 type:complete len:81 (+) comp15105_c1_seq78:2104-2346(+)
MTRQAIKHRIVEKQRVCDVNDNPPFVVVYSCCVALPRSHDHLISLFHSLFIGEERLTFRMLPIIVYMPTSAKPCGDRPCT